MLGDPRGQIDHVGAGVAAFGQRRLDTVRLLIAGQQRLTEQTDLSSGVVDVVLARDRVASRVEHRRQRIAEHRAAAVTDL